MSASRNVRAGRAYVEVTADSSKLSASLSKAQAALRNFSKTAQSVGRELLTLGTVAAAPFALATKNFAAFDDTMRLVQGVTGTTGKAFDSLTKKAQALGRETSFTAQQAAEAMVSLGRMGFSSREIEDAIGSVLDLSRATGTDLAQAADIAANSMRIFGIGAADMTHVADILTATANGSAQTLVDLFEALKVAGPQAVAAGEDITQTAAAIGVLANVGIKGSLAGTALRKSFSQFASADVRDYLADFGVQTVDATGNLRAMADVMRDLAGVMSALPTADKLAFAEQVFDLRGSLAGLSITADPASLDAFSKKLSNVNGVARETSQTMDKGLGGSFRLFASAAEGAANATGTAIATTLQPLMESATRTINSFTKWIEVNQGVVTTIAAVAAAGVTLGATLMAIGAASSLVSRGIGGINAVVKITTKLFGLHKAAATGAAAANTALAASFRLVGIAAATIGIVGLIAGLAALAGSFMGASSAAVKLRDEMKKAREAGDEERTADRARMQRLQQLAQKQQLTNEETAEAATLAETLQAHYGNLGITVDRLGNSLTIATDAQKRMSKAMRDVTLRELNAELAEAHANLYAVSRAHKRVMGVMNATANVITFSSKEETANEIKESLQRVDAAQARLDAVRARIEAVRNGEEDAATTGAANDATALQQRIADEEAKTLQQRLDAKQAAADAEKRVLEIETQLRREQQSALENEIEDIRKLAAEYQELLTKLRDIEAAKPNADRARIDALNAQIANSRAEAEARINALKAASTGDVTSEMQQTFADAEQAQKERAAYAALDALEERNAAAAVGVIERLAEKLSRAMAAAGDAYRAQVAQATADGMVSEKEAEAIEAAREAYLNASEMRQTIGDRLASAREAAKESSTKTGTAAVGSFFARAMRSLGATSVQDKQLKATETVAQNTKRAAQLLEEMAAQPLAFL